MHGLGLLVGIGTAAALLLVAVGALSVATSDDAEATEAVVESIQMAEEPCKPKGLRYSLLAAPPLKTTAGPLVHTYATSALPSKDAETHHTLSCTYQTSA